MILGQAVSNREFVLAFLLSLDQHRSKLEASHVFLAKAHHCGAQNYRLPGNAHLLNDLSARRTVGLSNYLRTK